jgi:hypothetical protein
MMSDVIPTSIPQFLAQVDSYADLEFGLLLLYLFGLVRQSVRKKDWLPLSDFRRTIPNYEKSLQRSY